VDGAARRERDAAEHRRAAGEAESARRIPTSRLAPPRALPAPRERERQQRSSCSVRLGRRSPIVAPP